MSRRLGENPIPSRSLSLTASYRHYALCGLIDVVLAEAFEDGIGPAEADLGRIDAFHRWFVGADNVVFLEENAVRIKPVEIALQPFHGDATGVLMITVALQAANRQQ